MRTRLLPVTGLMLALLMPLAGAQQASSQYYRLSHTVPASVAAEATSSTYVAAIAGGSSMPVGIAASDHGTVVAGPGSAPAGDFIFANAFELPLGGPP